MTPGEEWGDSQNNIKTGRLETVGGGKNRKNEESKVSGKK